MSSAAVETPHARGVDMKLEVVVIPVSDARRSSLTVLMTAVAIAVVGPRRRDRKKRSWKAERHP